MADLEDESGGRITFDYYPGESLVALSEQFDAVKNGVIDMGFTSAAYEPDRLGIVAATSNLPYNFPLDGFAEVWRDEGQYYELAAQHFEANGLHLLSWPPVPEAIIISTEPILSTEDMRGKLIRTLSSAYPALNALGIEPADIPTSELYAALQRKTIDGAILSVESVLTGSYYEVAPYVLRVDSFYTGALQLIMNQDVYEQLPMDLKELIDRLILEHESALFQSVVDREVSSLEELTGKSGVQIHSLQPEELQQFKSTVTSVEPEIAAEYGDEWSDWQRMRDQMFEASAG